MNAHATFAQPTIKLFDYQQEAVDSLFRCWEQGEGTGHLIIVPVGGGKTIICSSITHRLCQMGGKKVLILTHVRELIEQNYLDLRRYWPAAPVGIFSASLGRKNFRPTIVVGGVQSVARNLDKFRHVDAIIVDEAHLIPHEDDGQYREIIRHCRAINPKCKLIGLTGTPYRLNSGNLLEPWKDNPPLFDTVAYEMTMSELLERGRLCRMTARATKTKLDLSKVKKAGGEYVAGDLDAAVNSEQINRQAVAEIVAAGAERRSWLVFAISIDHAERLRDMLRGYGVSCEAVHSKMGKPDRARIISGFKSYRIRCLVNVGCLTTGFNHPTTDLVAFLRPTMSPGLFVQMAGRGLRTAEGKQNCLALDFAGLTLRHGLVDAVRGIHKRKGEEEDNEPKAKECPVCSHLNPPGTSVCEECEFPFPVRKQPTAAERESKLSARPTVDRVMNEAAEEIWATVLSGAFQEHRKEGSPPMVRLTYDVDVAGRRAQASEVLCFEHEGWAQKKAHEIWRRRSIIGLAPSTTAEALSRMNELRRPRQLLIRANGAFFDVISARLT